MVVEIVESIKLEMD